LCAVLLIVLRWVISVSVVESLTFLCRSLSSVSERFLWDCWWIKWCLDKFFFKYFFYPSHFVIPPVLIAHIHLPGALYGLDMFQLLNRKKFCCCEAGNQFSCGCGCVTSFYMTIVMQGFKKPFWVQFGKWTKFICGI